MGDGNGWTDKKGWDKVTYAGDWAGVYMDDNSSIKALAWGSSNNLTGKLPIELGNFNAVLELSFPNNNIYGTVPSSIKKLTTLKAFSIEDNRLLGTLPDFSQMPDLFYVSIEKNFFTFSDIEPQIENFRGLDTFADHPQADIDESNHDVVYFNESLPLVIIPTLVANQSGNDEYHWKHASTATGQPSTLDYNLSRVYTKMQPIKADEGYYSYWVENVVVSHVSTYSGSTRNLLLVSTGGPKAIHAVYNHAPTVSNTPDLLEEIEVDSTYSYTPNASDADQDPLSFSITNKPAWLTFETATGELSGTPTQSDIGEYTIAIAVSDSKQTTDINYTLTVLPKDLEPQTPVAPVNNSYKHSLTNNTIATALTNPKLHLYLDSAKERAMFIEKNYCSSTAYHAYIGFPYSGGKLYTGYLKCGSNEVFKSTVENNAYPNGSTATLLNEPNTNKPMIMIEVKLTDTTPSITIGE
jgi:hypothetical protein